MAESLQLFVEIYSSRKRTDREFWLLDTTHLQADKGYEGIFDELKDLKLDLDDDLFLFNYGAEGKVIKIFEFYEIHPTIPRQMLPYASWDSVNGLSLNEDEKWERRRNLQVFEYFTLYFIKNSHDPNITFRV